MPPDAGVLTDQLRLLLVQCVDQPSERHQLGVLRAKLLLDSTGADARPTDCTTLQHDRLAH